MVADGGVARLVYAAAYAPSEALRACMLVLPATALLPSWRLLPPPHPSLRLFAVFVLRRSFGVSGLVAKLPLYLLALHLPGLGLRVLG